jgi:HAD superfamily hydrolase (TIGR01509 family)
MFEAILFDNDGVLVDTEGLYFRATREVLAEHGIALVEEDYVQLFLREARGAWHLLRARGAPEAVVERARAARNRRFTDLVDGGDILIPGAAAAVRALVGRYRLGIVTSSEAEPFARAHGRAGILEHFEFALTREQYEHSKPHPEPYLRAVTRVGLPAARCLVVEDSERGLRAAKAAGLTCWIVPSPLTRAERFEGADAILPDLGAVVRRLAAG